MRLIQIFILLTTATLPQQAFAQDTLKTKLATKSLFNTSHSTSVVALKDSTHIITAPKDSVLLKPKHDPHKATLRSAIIPGWGQAYNREYWKIPIVYGALAIPTITFIYNNTWYKRTKYAYTVVVTNDTADFKNINVKLQGLLSDPQDLQHYRNAFRKDRDYSGLWFFLVWGLNIADATVFGHLKDFDVSDDLSMHIQPTYNPITKTANMGLVLNFKTPSHKLLSANE